MGTIFGALFTYLVYLLLFVLTAATCERFLLVNNYIFMMGINLWKPFITIGKFGVGVGGWLTQSEKTTFHTGTWFYIFHSSETCQCKGVLNMEMRLASSIVMS